MKIYTNLFNIIKIVHLYSFQKLYHSGSKNLQYVDLDDGHVSSNIVKRRVCVWTFHFPLTHFQSLWSLVLGISTYSILFHRPIPIISLVENFLIKLKSILLQISQNCCIKRPQFNHTSYLHHQFCNFITNFFARERNIKLYPIISPESQSLTLTVSDRVALNFPLPSSS